jgi:hypothetical protein
VGFEPDAVMIDDADDSNRHVEEARCNSRDAIKRGEHEEAWGS